MEVFTMQLHRLLLVTMILGVCHTGWAQSPTYGLGRTPSAEEIRVLDIAISPTGKELPPGHGTAKEGAKIYAQKCAACHGEKGSGGPAPTLIGGPGTAPPAGGGMRPGESMATHSPFATTIWDYINRGMPLSQEGTLKPDEVYALTAFLLYKANVIKEDEVLDEQSLPKIKMPNRDAYAPLPEWKHGYLRLPLSTQ